MNWYDLAKYAAQIVPFNEEDDGEDDERLGMDRYDAMDQADKAFQASGVRYDSRKRISQMAIEDGKVIGAVASGWSTEDGDEKDTAVFSFDIAVKPEFRGPAMVGMKLIAAAMQHYKYEASQYREMGFNTLMRLRVINPRLVPVLEKKFGFELESSHGDGSAHMIMY